MNATRKKVEDKISRKDKEIQEVESALEDVKREIETKLVALRAEKKGMMDILKMLPQDGDEAECRTIRPNSKAGKSQALLKENGVPMHVGDIIEAIGEEENNTKTRASLAGTLRTYVNRGEVFSLPSPNTFSLLEWGDNPPGGDEAKDDIVVNFYGDDKSKANNF